MPSKRDVVSVYRKLMTAAHAEYVWKQAGTAPSPWPARLKATHCIRWRSYGIEEAPDPGHDGPTHQSIPALGNSALEPVGAFLKTRDTLSRSSASGCEGGFNGATSIVKAFPRGEPSPPRNWEEEKPCLDDICHAACGVTPSFCLP